MRWQHRRHLTDLRADSNCDVHSVFNAGPFEPPSQISSKCLHNVAQSLELGVVNLMVRDWELIEYIIVAFFSVLDVVAVPQVIVVQMDVVAAAMAWVGVAAVIANSAVADVAPMAEDAFVVPAVHPAAVVVQAVGAVAASKLDAVPVSTTVGERAAAAAAIRCRKTMTIAVAKYLNNCESLRANKWSSLFLPSFFTLGSNCNATLIFFVEGIKNEYFVLIHDSIMEMISMF
ncbi:hypothetical protein TcWFU_001346 [Taenia crassiceps]|uniref:Uncharacterized protein n=1 Tax=Taenia crassiceps TaxID=6207 RepID=A0ABR4QC81_9CEST